MFTFLRRKGKSPPETPSSVLAKPSTGFLLPESATSLLASPRRQKLLEHIWQRTSLSRPQFATLYLAPLEHYAELVQQFPASEAHHHAYPGGMLDHGLEIVAYALKLRQSHLLPVGAPPETQAAQAEAWTAGIAYAALLHDIGKLAVDLHVEYGDGAVWHPWHGAVRHPYCFRYRKDRQYRLHSAATGLLYTRLLDNQILDWLSGFPELWSALLYVLSGQYEHAGVLGELVVQADQASVAQALGGDPTKALMAPRHALQRKLLDGMRYLLKEEFKLNQPQASDGWLTQDALWLVSKTVSDKLRAHLLSQGIDGVPEKNTAVFNVLQDHGIALPTPEGKAIWKATVASDTGWSHSFTFLKVAPALIWEANERPAAFAGTVRVEQGEEDAPEDEIATATPPAIDTTQASTKVPPKSALPKFESTAPTEAMSALFEPGPTEGSEVAAPSANDLRTDATSREQPKTTLEPNAEPTHAPADEPSGKHFIDWLRHGIQCRKLIINDAKALVHTVADTVYLVSPGVFMRYAQEQPKVTLRAKQEKLPEWEWVQKRFEQLHLHKKQPSGLNIWTCEVTGPRKSRRLHGYLLAEPSVLIEHALINNPYLSLKQA